MIPSSRRRRVRFKEFPMTNAPPPKRRGWIDALVATALRWNDRLSRPIGEAEAATPPRRAAASGGPKRHPEKRGLRLSAESDAK
jgi:hypothetical protein